MANNVVIIGGGSGGIGLASSLLKRKPNLDITIIEPSEKHSYQPGWTMVGAGVFDFQITQRPMSEVMPDDVNWIQERVEAINAETNSLTLSNGDVIEYDYLVVAPGLKLDWDAIPGLSETLGKNGVTSNYKEGLSKYTYELVSNMKSGKAIFTQPPMPIKCAGAPQKAMYLSGDIFFDNGVLKDIDIEFCNAGGVLFGVADYVPALMEYVKKYDAKLSFNENLVAIDGERKVATFATENGNVEKEFDMIHVCPPQTGHDFIKQSALANEGGWVDVDQGTLQSTKFANVFSLGDACSTPNAKTAAAVRKQIPVVAVNLLAAMENDPARAVYDGYGSCPLTVERGKIVLAEFKYGGVLDPSFPTWVINGTEPTRRAWVLKAKFLPWLYWNAMLKGREWLVTPEM